MCAIGLYAKKILSINLPQSYTKSYTQYTVLNPSWQNSYRVISDRSFSLAITVPAVLQFINCNAVPMVSMCNITSCNCTVNYCERGLYEHLYIQSILFLFLIIFDYCKSLHAEEVQTCWKNPAMLRPPVTEFFGSVRISCKTKLCS